MSKNADADASVAQPTERRSQMEDNAGAVASASRWCIRTRELLGLDQLQPDLQQDPEQNLQQNLQQNPEQNVEGNLEGVVEELIEEHGTVLETSDYPDKRREMLKRYFATLTPDGATQVQIKRLEEQRKVVLDQLPEVGEEANIIEAGEQLEALKGVIKTVQLEIEAKAEHLRLLEVARQSIKASRSKFPLPPPNIIDDLFDAAKNEGEKANSIVEFKRANDLIQKVSDAIVAAEEYTKLYDEINGLMTGAKNILQFDWADTMKVSKDLAAKGQFNGAMIELKTIRDNKSLEDFVDYNKALKEFWTAASGMRKNEEPLSSLVNPKTGDFTKAKKLAPNFKDAAESIRNLIPTLPNMKQYYDQLIVVTKITEQKNLFEQLQQDQKELLEKELKIAKNLAKAGDYDKAKDVLDKLISAKNSKNEEWISDMSLYLRSLNAVYPTYTALQLIAKQSKAGLTTEQLFQEAKLKAQQQDFSGAAQDMDNLKKIVTSAYAYFDLKDKVIDLCIELPEKLVKDLLKPSQEAAEHEDYDDATSKLKDLLTSVKHLGPYIARNQEVESLKKLLDTDRQNELNDVLLRAEDLASSGDFAAGLAILQEIKQMPGLKEVDSDLSAFLRQLATVSKMLDGTLKLLMQKKPIDQSELRNSLTAKREEAKLVLDGQLDIKTGVDQLDKLAKLLLRVNMYGKERLKAYAMAHFLERESVSLDKDIKLWEQEKTSLEQEILTLQNQVSLDNKAKDTLSKEVKNIKSDIKAIKENKSTTPLSEQELKEVLDKALKKLESMEKTFKEKTDALQELKKKVAGLQENVKKLKGFVEQSSALLPKLTINSKDVLEEGDKAGLGLSFEEAITHYQDACLLLTSAGEALVYQLEKNESGHCLSAHGPSTSVNLQQARVMTGKRPDGPKMPSQFGCKFDKIEDFIMTRQLAFEMANENPPEPNWSLDNKVLKLDKNGKAVDSITHYIEHDRPIDTAVMGLKENLVVKLGGPEIGEVAVGDTYETILTVCGLTRTRSVFSFVRSQEPDQNNEVRGKWVLHQQFPEARDWEPAEPFKLVDNNNTFQSTSGRYTAPLPGV